MSDVNPVVGVMDDAIDFVRKANDRTYAAEVRVKELEAQCAAMRGALDEALKFVAVTPWTNKAPWTDDRLNGLFEAGQAALSGDAGRALLERVENLERLRRAVKNAIGQDGTDDWSDVIGILDALETKQ